MVRRMTVLGVFVTAGLLLASVALADDAKKPDDKKGDDNSFVTEAATGGMLEVKLGQLAVDRAASPDVKKFGQRMVDDHTKANKDLMSIADKMGVKVSHDMPKKQQGMIDDLTKLKGTEFDRAYMKMMVKDHEQDVKEFEDASKNCKDENCKAFAAKALPTLREHLKMAKEIADGLSKENK